MGNCVPKSRKSSFQVNKDPKQHNHRASEEPHVDGNGKGDELHYATIDFGFSQSKKTLQRRESSEYIMIKPDTDEDEAGDLVEEPASEGPADGALHEEEPNREDLLNEEPNREELHNEEPNREDLLNEEPNWEELHNEEPNDMGFDNRGSTDFAQSDDCVTCVESTEHSDVTDGDCNNDYNDCGEE